MNLVSTSVRRSLAALGVVGAALATILTMALPAHAVSGYTPSGGPAVNFVGSNVVFSVDSTGQQLDCPTFNMGGDVFNPGVNRAFGADGLTLDSLVAQGCTNPIAGPTTVTPFGTWGVAVTGPEVNSVSPVNLHDVQVEVEATGGACTFQVVGDVDGTFDDATQVFTPTNSNLEVAASPAPSGSLCIFLGVQPGVGVSFDSGTWTNVPPTGSSPVTITNP